MRVVNYHKAGAVPQIWGPCAKFTMPPNSWAVQYTLHQILWHSVGMPPISGAVSVPKVGSRAKLCPPCHVLYQHFGVILRVNSTEVQWNDSACAA